MNWKRMAAAALMAGSLQVGVLVGAVAGVAPVTSAYADEWCDSDPPINIFTPAGNHITLHATFYGLGKVHQDAVNHTKMWYVVESKRAPQNRHDSNFNKDDKTEVAVFAVVPGDKISREFPVKAVISTGLNGSGKVHATAASHATELMVLRFTLDVP